jgi:hypothetical protein
VHTEGQIAGRAEAGNESQVHVTLQRGLSALAILLFIGYFFSRHLDWAVMHVVANRPLTSGMTDLANLKVLTPGTEWSDSKVPIALCAFAIAWGNVLFIVSATIFDQLVPAITNTVVGAALVAMTGYFMVSVNEIFGSVGRNINFEYELVHGVAVAMLLAVALFATGLAQLTLRLRAGD